MKSAAPIDLFSSAVLPLVRQLQALQTDNGSFERTAAGAASSLLTELCRALAAQDPAVLTADQWRAFHADVDEWLQRGLEEAPRFDRSRDATPAPADGGLATFVGPVFLPNSGQRAPKLQAILVHRREPDAFPLLNERFPHPHNMCQSTQVVVATAGVTEGDCVVFFPENIPARAPLARQRFAWFFFDKHTGIYARTLRLVRAACGNGPFPTRDGRLVSAHMDPEATYQARCAWGYLHDYYHHTGPRPLHEQLGLKTSWVQGVLEEIKVDSQAAVAGMEQPDVPHGEAVYEFVLLERLFRYPVEPDRAMNADSASGVLLARWLVEHGALRLERGRAQLAGQDAVLSALRDLVDAITTLEQLPDDLYVERSEAWLYDLLDVPSEPYERYKVPSDLAASTLWSSAAPARQ